MPWSAATSCGTLLIDTSPSETSTLVSCSTAGDDRRGARVARTSAASRIPRILASSSRTDSSKALLSADDASQTRRPRGSAVVEGRCSDTDLGWLAYRNVLGDGARK